MSLRKEASLQKVIKRFILEESEKRRILSAELAARKGHLKEFLVCVACHFWWAAEFGMKRTSLFINLLVFDENYPSPFKNYLNEAVKTLITIWKEADKMIRMEWWRQLEKWNLFKTFSKLSQKWVKFEWS